MKNNYTEESGGTFDEASDIAVRLKVLAGEIYNMQTTVEWLKKQIVPATATGEFLDNFAAQRGLQRREAQKAKGTLVFRLNDTKSSVTVIPKGTVVSTDSVDPVKVYTTEDAVIAENTYSVTAPAEAELAGYRGNINGNTAVIPVSVPTEIDSFTNYGPFYGGTDRESDENLRARILDSYTNQPNGMNSAYYIALATSVEDIYKAGVIDKLRGTGTVNVYVCSKHKTVTDEKLAEVQLLMNQMRELNVNVLVTRASERLYDLDVKVMAKPGYEKAVVKEKCTAAFEDYIESLPIGGKLYLSSLGRYFMETGCVENYEFDVTMDSVTAANSQVFVAGDVNIEVYNG